MLTDQQIFKAAFLRRCAEHGVGPDEAIKLAGVVLSRIKQANPADMIPGYSAVNRFAGSLAEKAPGWAMSAYLGIPIVGGAAIGTTLAKAQNLADDDPSEIKTRERIEAYRRLAEQMAISRQLRDRRAASPGGGRSIMR